MRATVLKQHKPEIEELQLKLKLLNDDYYISKSKLTSIEDNMPLMIREMINYCLD